jgi:UDP:flavonoid glycosyltransferase YjiC (YdhE family)
MRRLLIGWELGGGLGHAYRLLPIGLALRASQFEAIFVVPPCSPAARLLEEQGFFILPAPGWPPIEEKRLSLNYAENLLKNGYARPDQLREHLLAWLGLIEQHQPHGVLAEHAPTLLLAARIAGLPRLAIGTGFSLPPLTTPMPTLQPWFPIPQERLAQAEQRLLASVNPVLIELGAAPLKTVAAIFAGAERLLCTFPETDHYTGRSGDTGCKEHSYHGALLYSPPVEREEELPWLNSTDPGSGVFLYLNAGNRLLHRCPDELAGHRLPTLAFIPDLPAAGQAALQRPGLVVIRRPVNLRAVAPRCRFMVSQGGHNAGVYMLLQGIPLLLLPRQLEQALWSHRLSQQRLGLTVNPFDPQPPMGEKIETLLTNDHFSCRAQAFATRYAACTEHSSAPIHRLLAWCADLSQRSAKID